MRWRLVGVLAGGLIPAASVAEPAQSPEPGVLWQRPSSVLSANRLEVVDRSRTAPDYRWEGMAIGAGVGALAFGFLGAVVCGQSDSAKSCTGIVVGTALLGVLAGGITGGLVGGAIPKGAADSTAATARSSRHRYHASR
jgi:hypothetical protein